MWEGAEYRGRGRETIWDGTAEIRGNTVESFSAINFWNPARPLSAPDRNHLDWRSITTGGFSGFEIRLADPVKGSIKLATPLVKEELAFAEIGEADTVLEAGGLGRRLRAYRLPDNNPHRSLEIELRPLLQPAGVHPLYVRLTQEDGHRVWSSPIYVNVRAS